VADDRFRVRELVARCRPCSDEEAATWERRVRIWTDCRVYGDVEHLGTGHHRRYGRDDVLLTAVLQRLAWVGLYHYPLGIGRLTREDPIFRVGWEFAATVLDIEPGVCLLLGDIHDGLPAYRFGLGELTWPGQIAFYAISLTNVFRRLEDIDADRNTERHVLRRRSR
jgi:hypothetical protein